VDAPPRPKVKRRDKDAWPAWRATTRCLDCPFTRVGVVQARDQTDARTFTRATLPPPTKAHAHRYVTAVGPA